MPGFYPQISENKIKNLQRNISKKLNLLQKKKKLGRNSEYILNSL